MPKIPHVEVGLNHWFPPLMDQITREAIEFARRTGYEGIRFDVGLFAPNRVVSVLGEKLPFNEADKMPHAARNFQQFERALRGVFPNFEFGANMDSWAYLENVGLRGITPPPPESYPEFVAFAKVGGLFMDEGTMSVPRNSRSSNAPPAARNPPSTPSSTPPISSPRRRWCATFPSRAISSPTPSPSSAPRAASAEPRAMSRPIS